MTDTKPMGAIRKWLVVGLCLLCGPSFADQPAGGQVVKDEPTTPISGLPAADPLAWLDRISGASRQLNYVGTFSYQTGWRTETSRIAHRYANGVESERMEVLDGSPREIIRQGKEMRCVLPAQRTVIIGQAGKRGNFPGRLPHSHAELTGNYHIRLDGVGRIAGHEAQKLVLMPRDELRFGHVFWVELKTGLLLKSQMLDPKGEVVEQFAFSNVHIGGKVGDELLAPRVKVDADWRTVDVGGDDEAQFKSQWALREPLPGFSLMTMMRHRNGGALQMVFSDGLAAISIFIEPAEAGVEARGAYPGGGAVNVFERVAGGHRITVLGEVPAPLVQRAAEAVEVLK
ncbi:MAG: MucB/RseB C-terminal domain-containing protein [Betaproteobacteria bacterium]|jgi:sigma-E factor negative regulatory protein RseB|nr:MucB/RseB C-terminal domain-containing protein [Betaproteobacteria bacterium]